jgi:hypothetical protein
MLVRDRRRRLNVARAAVAASEAGQGLCMKVAKAAFRVGAAAQKTHGAAEDSEERDAVSADAKRAATTWFHNGRFIRK